MQRRCLHYSIILYVVAAWVPQTQHTAACGFQVLPVVQMHVAQRWFSACPPPTPTPTPHTRAQGSELRSRAWVLDYDEQWASEPHWAKYDFKQPGQLPEALHGAFDCVVIDPPFITREVWELYAQAAKLLLAPGGDWQAGGACMCGGGSRREENFVVWRAGGGD